MANRRLIAIDCETDPFLNGRIPQPFIWGAFDGKNYYIERDTKVFVAWLQKQNCYAYAHNGGKFDFMYFLPFIKETRVRLIGGRAAEMTFGKAKLRDSYSIIPVPLGAIHKDKINYDLMEPHCREKYMDSDIIPYLKTDVRVLWETVNQYRKIAGGKLTIASNAMASSKKLGIDPGRTNYRFDTEMRQYYFGGRTECFQPGTHENISVIDIVSSYPNAMMKHHPTGENRTTLDGPDALKNMSKDQIDRSFIRLNCFSDGAFPKRADNGGLEFPKNDGEYFVTGWEYNVAKKHGLIFDEKIISVTTFDDKITFKPYIEKWFKFKKDHPKKKYPINYTIGKVMMNSLYGKLAQNPLKYFDYKFCEGDTPCDFDNGWTIYSEFGNTRIHRREVMWNYINKYGVDWVKRPLFYNVASGASVTGSARADLLDAIHNVGEKNIIYCDTDSLVLRGDSWKKLTTGKEIGQWDFEGKATIGHFAGKKLYAMKLEEIDPETNKPMEKIASKGSKLNFDDLRRIIRGETVKWKNDAPSFSYSKGLTPNTKNVDTKDFFIHRNITATAPSLKRKFQL